MPFEDSELVPHNQTMKARESRIASAALGSACVMSLVRAFLLPWLISIAPKNTFAGMEAHSIQMVSLTSAALFFILALWASKEPLWPAIVALIFYSVLSYPDLLNQPGFLAKGILSKAIMLCILLRALAAGLVHRMTTSSTIPSRW